MKTVQGLLKEGTGLLKEVGLKNPARDTELLLGYSLELNKLSLYTSPNKPVSAEKTALFYSYISRRAVNEPLSYIIGTKEFMDCTFLVNRNVLIPRPETEHLVEEAIALSKGFLAPVALDLGTGSGCIAVCFKKAVPQAQLTAVDVSEAALMTARKNARANNISGINFRRSDLFSALEENEDFDLIVSNPPYITTEEYAALLPETKLFEPELALQGGSDGLEFYRKILFEAPARLRQGGFLLFEVGYRQAGQVSDMIESTGKLKTQKVVRDLAYIERVVIASRI